MFYSFIDTKTTIYQYDNMEKNANNTSILMYCKIEVFHYYLIGVLSYSECPLVLFPKRITY